MKDLVADIKANGLHESVWIFEGKILDGRHRYRACKLAGVPCKTRQFNGTHAEAVAFVWSLNFARRHLNSSQAAIADAKRNKLLDLYREVKQAAQERKQATQAKPGEKVGNHQAAKVPEKIPAPKNESETREVRAKVAGTNGKYINLADKIIEERPDLAAKVEQGEMTLSQVQREIKRETILSNLENVEVKQAKALEGVYDVIVIDPPWPMEKIERDVRPNQSEFDYPTMTESQLRELKIPAAENCHVWLWTTHKFLPMALRLLDSWGFKYVCCFTWHKPGGFQPIGLPQYNCEFAIYGRRGVPVFVETKAFPVCFDAKRGSHSEKPETFYEMVRRVTAGRRLDMFNRREIEGFDGWGKESPV